MKHSTLPLICLILLYACGDNRQPRQNQSSRSPGPKGGTLETVLDQQGNGLARKYSPKGTLLAEVEIRRGKKQGVGKKWRKDGSLLEESHFKNDLLEGLSIRYDKSGKRSEEKRFYKGELHGTSKSWDENGVLQHEAQYKNGKKDGRETSWLPIGLYFPGAETRRIHFYQDGVKKRSEEHFTDYRGVPTIRETIFMEEETLERLLRNQVLQEEKTSSSKGSILRKYQNGKLISESLSDPSGTMIQMLTPGDILRQTLYYRSGMKRISFGLRHDRLDGDVAIWWENGHRKMTGRFREGKQNGLIMVWYECERPKLEAMYEEGRLVSAKAWDEDGFPLKEVQTKAIIDSQETVDIHPRPSLPAPEPAKENVLHETFFDNGNLSTRGMLDSERYRIGTWEEYFENGQIKSRGVYDNRVEEGIWEHWFENGQVQFHIGYRSGKRHGPSESWYAGGGVKSREEYRDGLKEGLFQFWNEKGLLLSSSEWKADKQIRERWIELGYDADETPPDRFMPLDSQQTLRIRELPQHVYLLCAHAEDVQIYGEIEGRDLYLSKPVQLGKGLYCSAFRLRRNGFSAGNSLLLRFDMESQGWSARNLGNSQRVSQLLVIDGRIWLVSSWHEDHGDGGSLDWGGLIQYHPNDGFTTHPMPEPEGPKHCGQGRITAFRLSETSIHFLHGNFNSDLHSDCPPFGRLLTFSRKEPKRHTEHNVVIGIRDDHALLTENFQKMLNTLIWLEPRKDPK